MTASSARGLFVAVKDIAAREAAAARPAVVRSPAAAAAGPSGVPDTPRSASQDAEFSRITMPSLPPDTPAGDGGRRMAAKGMVHTPTGSYPVSLGVYDPDDPLERDVNVPPTVDRQVELIRGVDYLNLANAATSSTRSRTWDFKRTGTNLGGADPVRGSVETDAGTWDVVFGSPKD